MFPNDLIQDVPDLGPLLFDHLLGALDSRDLSPLFQLVVNEGLEKLEGHFLGEPALMQTEFRADDNDRAARIIDSLAQQVLAEAAGLSLEHITHRLERPAVLARDRPSSAAIVEESIHSLLQHPLLVADDHIRRVKLHEP